MKLLKLAIIILLSCVGSFAQTTNPPSALKTVATLPSTCRATSPAQILIKTGSSAGVYYCSAANTWTKVATSADVVPGGSTTQLQYNNAGAFGGISGATSNGTATTYSSDNLIATSPHFITGIDDTNGNQIIGLTPTASADDYLNVTNGTSSVTIASAGADTNIDLNVNVKGAANVSTNAAALVLSTGFISLRNNTATKIEWGTSGTQYGIITGASADTHWMNFTFGTGISFAPSGTSTQGVGLRSTTAGVLTVTDASSGVGDVKLRGLQLSTGSKPTCNSTNRGYIWYVAGGAGVADTAEICRKDNLDAYAWTSLY